VTTTAENLDVATDLDTTGDEFPVDSPAGSHGRLFIFLRYLHVVIVRNCEQCCRSAVCFSVSLSNWEGKGR